MGFDTQEPACAGEPWGPCCSPYFLWYTWFTTIEQTVEIPASRRITIDVPREVPTGRTILTFRSAGETLPKPGKPGTRAQRLLGACAELADISLEELRSERLGKYL